MTNVAMVMPDSIKGLSLDQQSQIMKLVQIDEYKAQMKTQIKSDAFDVQQKLEEFLEFKTSTTKYTYGLYIGEFLNYIARKNIHPLAVNYQVVDRLIGEELSEFSNAKAELYLASVSAFYSTLARWRDIDVNPFIGAILKKKVSTEIKVIPTESEIDTIINYFSMDTKAHKKMRLVLFIMKTYGVRVGFFNGEIEYYGTVLSSISKGKLYRVMIKENDQEYISNNIELLNECRKNTIQCTFANAMKVLKMSFSVHDFRHFVACREYLFDKDIYRVSKLLNHASIGVTEKYLKGLEVMNG